MTRSSGPRKSADLSKSLQHRLDIYAIAARAAGVGILALAQPSEAKIVYTAAHVRIAKFDNVVLDVNHDGKGDFTFYAGVEGTSGFDWQYLFADRYRSGVNGVFATSTGLTKQAVALRAGARIGPSRFFNGFNSMARHFTANTHSHSTNWKGEWANGGKGLKNHYLGLKFRINGKFHFGWARVTLTVSGKSFTALLTGYAYETIPSKSIKAGQTKEATGDRTNQDFGRGASLTSPIPDKPQHATLGTLALGRK